jgi:hypothetical protein
MLSFYPVEIDHDLTRDNPLYVGNFFNLERMWWRKRKQRQGLIISMAVAWHRLMKRNPGTPVGFIEEEVLITNLTRQVKDAKIILERFFDITRVGFNFNDGNKSPTLVKPRRLSKKMVKAIEEIMNEVQFAPGLPPTKKNLVQTTVTVQSGQTALIRSKLKAEGREDLLAPVNWLLKQEGQPITFYYEPAGKLQARDTSIWPIRAIELWPGWLRSALFGTAVDIENAYVQFLLATLTPRYVSKPGQLSLKYPDLLRAQYDKQKFREELCRDMLKLPINDDNIKVVKQLIMALANGSNATPALMTNGSGRSEAVRIVLQANPNLLPTDLIIVGKRLSSIAKQFKAAKRELCLVLLGAKPSRQNQRLIFSKYLEWERESRYKLWEASGRTGLMIHDGLDGVVTKLDYKEFNQLLVRETNLRVSVDGPKELREHLLPPCPV